MSVATHPPQPTPHLREAPEAWVPVDRRWLGLDKRTLRPGLVMIVWFLLMVVIIPLIAQANEAPATRISAGDVVELRDGVSFKPPTGWFLDSGHLRGQAPNSGYSESARVSQDGNHLSVLVGSFGGTPAELMTAILRQEASSPNSAQADIRTTSGIPGVTTRISSGNTEVLLVAFVTDGVGIQVRAAGPAQQVDAPTQAVRAAIDSISRSAS